MQVALKSFHFAFKIKSAGGLVEVGNLETLLGDVLLCVDQDHLVVVGGG